MRAWEILKRGGWDARERGFQRPLKPTSLVTFLFGDKKVTLPAKGKLYSKIYPQPLWNVENISVEKFHTDFTSTDPVEKI